MINLRNLKLKNDNINHNNPFDRLLLSQSVSENLTFYTTDICCWTMILRTSKSFNAYILNVINVSVYYANYDIKYKICQVFNIKVGNLLY